MAAGGMEVEEIESLIESAQAGDLTQRLDTASQEGFFRAVSDGMNELLGVMSNALDDIDEVTGALAGGDLTHRMEGDYQGAFATVKGNINRMVDQLGSTVGEVRESADLMMTASDEISMGNNNLSQRTEEQAASLEQTASSMEELTSTVKQNADNAQQANQLASGARSSAQKGGDVVKRAVTAMDAINTSSNKIAEIIGAARARFRPTRGTDLGYERDIALRHLRARKKRS